MIVSLTLREFATDFATTLHTKKLKKIRKKFPYFRNMSDNNFEVSNLG